LIDSLSCNQYSFGFVGLNSGLEEKNKTKLKLKQDICAHTRTFEFNHGFAISIFYASSILSIATKYERTNQNLKWSKNLFGL